MNWQQDVRKVWGRDFQDLPIHTDLPRICGKITVERDGIEVLGIDEADNIEVLDRLQDVVCAIALVTGGSAEESATRKSLQTHLPRNDDKSGSVAKFLASGTLSIAVVSTLKLCHQRIIFPAYYYLKHCLGPEFAELRDSRGKWWITINALSSGEVCVTHRKGQRSAEFATDQGECEFELEWNLQLLLSQNWAEVKTVAVNVPEPPVFHPSYPEAKRVRFLEMLTKASLMPDTPVNPRASAENRGPVGRRRMSEVVEGWMMEVLQANIMKKAMSRRSVSSPKQSRRESEILRIHEGADPLDNIPLAVLDARESIVTRVEEQETDQGEKP